MQLVKKTLCILWNPAAHCRAYKSPALVPIMSQINPIHAIPFIFLKILLDIFLPTKTRSSSWSLSHSLPHQKSVCTSAYHLASPSLFSWFHHAGDCNNTTGLKITTESTRHAVANSSNCHKAVSERACLTLAITVVSYRGSKCATPKCIAHVIHRVLLFWF